MSPCFIIENKKPIPHAHGPCALLTAQTAGAAHTYTLHFLFIQAVQECASIFLPFSLPPDCVEKKMESAQRVSR